VSLIASYLDVPLRYPLRLGGSRSYVLDRAPSVESSSLASAISSAPLSTTMRTMEFPLFFESQETTRSAYAIFLLNKVGLLAKLRVYLMKKCLINMNSYNHDGVKWQKERYAFPLMPSY
jgi:hypothetical protein